MEMARFLLSLTRDNAPVQSVNICRIIFEDINLSSVVSVGLCEQLVATNLNLDVRQSSSSRRSSQRSSAASSATPQATSNTSARSVSSAYPPDSSAASSHTSFDPTGIDYAQMLDDQPVCDDMCEPEDDHTPISWNFGNGEISSKVHEYIGLLEEEWDNE